MFKMSKTCVVTFSWQTLNCSVVYSVEMMEKWLPYPTSNSKLTFHLSDEITCQDVTNYQEFCVNCYTATPRDLKLDMNGVINLLVIATAMNDIRLTQYLESMYLTDDFLESCPDPKKLLSYFAKSSGMMYWLSGPESTLVSGKLDLSSMYDIFPEWQISQTKRLCCHLIFAGHSPGDVKKNIVDASSVIYNFIDTVETNYTELIDLEDDHVAIVTTADHAKLEVFISEGRRVLMVRSLSPSVQPRRLLDYAYELGTAEKIELRRCITA